MKNKNCLDPRVSFPLHTSVDVERPEEFFESVASSSEYFSAGWTIFHPGSADSAHKVPLAALMNLRQPSELLKTNLDNYFDDKRLFLSSRMSHPRYRTLWSLVLDGGLRSWNPEKLRLVLSPQRQFDSPRTRLNEVYVEYQDQNSYLSGFLIFSIVLGGLASLALLLLFSLASLLLFSLAACASSLLLFISYKRKMLLSYMMQKFTDPPLLGPGVPLLLPQAQASSSSSSNIDIVDWRSVHSENLLRENV